MQICAQRIDFFFLNKHLFIYWLWTRKPELCRVLYALPSVKTRTLGKEPLCRVPHLARHLCWVPDARHNLALSKDALCRVPDTRQTIALGKRRRWYTPSTFAERQGKALDKAFFIFYFFSSKLFLRTFHFVSKRMLKFGIILNIFPVYL